MHIKPIYKGIFYTFLASFFWGIPQPLFFNEIKFLPVIEVTFHRGLWSFFCILLLVLIMGKINDFLLIFFSIKKIIILTITALLITINWTGFIFAVSIERVQDASMGYYLTPIISIALGYFFLNEKISVFKGISILMMIGSVIFLVFSLKTLPILAIVIGLSWGIYGLLRKQVSVSAEIGLLYESFFITLFAIPYLLYINSIDAGNFITLGIKVSFLMMLTGAVTAFPLFFFNKGVKFIPLGFAGVIFFLAPSLHFFTSAFILNEYISYQKIVAFIIIWVAVIFFIFDTIRNEKTNENNTQ